MFSPLQRHILRECFGKKGEAVGRGIFLSYYNNKKVHPVKSGAAGPPSAEFHGVKKEDRVNIITKSLERLIDHGMLIGYGVRTTKKWFIKNVKLTPLGRKKWVQWLGSRQTKLPLR